MVYVFKIPEGNSAGIKIGDRKTIYENSSGKIFKIDIIQMKCATIWFNTNSSEGRSLVVTDGGEK